MSYLRNQNRCHINSKPCSKTKKKSYTRAELEKYLKSLGLDDAYTDHTGKTQPINTGFVVTFEIDEDPKEEAFAILATGLWQFQSWVLQT